MSDHNNTPEKEVEVYNIDEHDQGTEDVEVDVRRMGDPPAEEKDILWALHKPLEDMSDEELHEAVRRIREMRKVKLTTTKKKGALDYMLSQLSPEKAASLLKQLEEKERELADAKDKDKDKEQEEPKKDEAEKVSD